MKVYVVVEYEKYEGNRIVAVFDSEEKADNYIFHHDRGDPLYELECQSYIMK